MESDMTCHVGHLLVAWARPLLRCSRCSAVPSLPLHKLSYGGVVAPAECRFSPQGWGG